MEPDNEYPEKLLAYFDQNIISLLVKSFSDDDPIYKYFSENFQVIYSDITLDEIYKADLNSNNSQNYEKYLNALQRLKAHHIRIAVSQDFKPMNSCIISTVTPNEKFEQYLQNKLEWDFLNSEPINNVLMLYSEKPDLEEFKRQSLSNFDQLIEHMKKESNKVREIPELDLLCSMMLKTMTINREVYKAKLESMYTQIASQPITSPMFKSFRSAVGVDAKQLNNITGENVLHRIWELYRSNKYYENVSFEDFWFQGIKYIEPNRPRFNYEYANILYGVMNLIGYYQDTKLGQVNGIERSLRDQSHAGLASFCNYFFTNDIKLQIKTCAIYDYLNIETILCSVNIKKTEN